LKRVVELSAKHPIKDGKFDLAPVAAALGSANTKVFAMTAAASSAGKMMNVRMFVDNPASAKEALSEAQIKATENEALSFKVVNRQGALAQVTAALGPANTGITAMTAAASSAGRMLDVYMLVENPAIAVDALETKVIF
jgi:hypothetical protein